MNFKNLKNYLQIILMGCTIILLLSSITTAEESVNNMGFLNALENGEDIEVIREYLRKGADPNYRLGGVYGPPLKSAAKGNVDIEVVELLLEYGATPEVHYFMIYGCNLDIIRLLAENGADLNNSISMTSIYDPLTVIDNSFIEEEMEEYNLQNELFYTLIDPDNIPQLSSEYGIEAGVAVAGYKPLLTVAVEAGRIELVELLIEYGADVNVDEPAIDFHRAPLVAACRNTEKPELIRTLIRGGSDLDITDSTGYTPLMAAAASGNLKACQSLLIYGVDVNDQSSLMMTPLLGAVRSKNPELVSLLIDKGANLEVVYDYGMNILHQAVLDSTPEVVEILIENGMDPVSTDNEKRTPYHLALVHQKMDIMGILANNGGAKIISRMLSEYLKDREPTPDDSLLYRFSLDGLKLLTIDREGARDHIRVWHRNKDDFFLTRLDYMFKVPEGNLRYNIYNNLYLSDDGNFLIIYDADNKKIYLDGLKLNSYKSDEFEEAAGVDTVSLSMVCFNEEEKGIAAVYKRDNKYYLKIWDIKRMNTPYPYLSARDEQQLNIDSDFADSTSILRLEAEGYNTVNLFVPDGEQMVKINIDEFSTEQEELSLVMKSTTPGIDNTIYSYQTDTEEKTIINSLTFSAATDNEYSTYKEYINESGAFEMLQEAMVSNIIITAGFDAINKSWIFLTDEGITWRDLMTREEAAIRDTFAEVDGMLEAGFHKQWLEKIRGVMSLDPTSKYFRSESYLGMALKGIQEEYIGNLLLLNYNLLMEEEKTRLVKQEITLRLLEYGLFAERAGQRGLTRQAAELLQKLSTRTEFKDYQFTMEIASDLLEAVYLASGDNPENAYDYLLDNEVFSEESTSKSKIVFLNHIKFSPVLWQALFRNPKKISYLTGISESEAEKVVYTISEMRSYPDLDGNIIEGIDNGTGTDNININQPDSGNDNSENAGNVSKDNSESSFGGEITSAIKSPEMVTVKAGTVKEETISSKNGYMQLKEISLKYDIEMGKYEVTHADFIEFLNDAKISPDGSYEDKKVIDIDDNSCAIDYDGSFYFEGSNRAESEDTPATFVTWFGAAAYCNWVSEQEGLTPAYNLNGCELKDDPENLDGYRLPTEGEWEYIARGGANGRTTTFAGSNDIEDVAWHKGNSEEKSHPVGEKKANELGIYDMSGNVWEWTNTRYSYQIIFRGGSWFSSGPYCEVGYRSGHNPAHRSSAIGFRLSKTKSGRIGDSLNTNNGSDSAF